MSIASGFRRVRAAVTEIVEATANKSLAIIISKTSQSVGTAERTKRASVGSAVGALNRADEEMFVGCRRDLSSERPTASPHPTGSVLLGETKVSRKEAKVGYAVLC